MTKREILKKRLAMAEQNMLCYSRTQTMDNARPGYEKEWAAAKEEVDTICEMMDELVCGEPGNESVMVRGTLVRWYTAGGNGLRITFVKLADKDGNRRILEVGRNAGEDLAHRYVAELEQRRVAGDGGQAVFRVDACGLVTGWEWTVQGV